MDKLKVTTFLIIMLSIGSWNVRGVLYTSQYLNNVADKCDILAITEHWLTENTVQYMDKFKDSYEIGVTIREEQRGYRGEGGVAVLVKRSNSTSIRIHNSTCKDVIGVTISRDNCVDPNCCKCSIPFK
jgi:exonuclease III